MSAGVGQSVSPDMATCDAERSMVPPTSRLSITSSASPDSSQRARISSCYARLLLQGSIQKYGEPLGRGRGAEIVADDFGMRPNRRGNGASTLVVPVEHADDVHRVEGPQAPIARSSHSDCGQRLWFEDFCALRHPFQSMSICPPLF